MFINYMFYFPHLQRENHLYVTHFDKVIKFCGFLFFSYKTKDHRISKILSLFKHKLNTIISFICNVLFIHQTRTGS